MFNSNKFNMAPTVNVTTECVAHAQMYYHVLCGHMGPVPIPGPYTIFTPYHVTG